MRLIRRFGRAFWTAVVATIVSIVLATWKLGPYDPTLAVLTATLVALIWYTFFTYCALLRVEESLLSCEIRRGSAGRTIEVEVVNETRERRIAFRWRLAGWRNGQVMSIDGSLSGTTGQRFVLRPGESRSEPVTIPPLRGVPGSTLGPAIQAGEEQEAIVRLDICWRDDLGEKGQMEPDYWSVDLQQCNVRRFQDPDAALKRWPALGGSVNLPPLAV